MGQKVSVRYNILTKYFIRLPNHRFENRCIREFCATCTYNYINSPKWAFHPSTQSAVSRFAANSSQMPAVANVTLLTQHKQDWKFEKSHKPWTLVASTSASEYCNHWHKVWKQSEFTRLAAYKTYKEMSVPRELIICVSVFRPYVPLYLQDQHRVSTGHKTPPPRKEKAHTYESKIRNLHPWALFNHLKYKKSNIICSL